MRECTEAVFLKDVAEHQMTVEHDDGVFRCLKFAKPGTNMMHFRLTTWPGYLAISGDMGAFVFWRTDDMFCFFRQKPYKDEKVSINVGYWMEKCEAQDTHGDGMREFDMDRVREHVREAWKSHFEDAIPGCGDDDDAEPDSPEARECWDAIEDLLARTDHNIVRIYDALNDFEHDGFRFHDVWEWRMTRPTFRMIWCLYAIAWGIQQYDAARNLGMEATTPPPSGQSAHTECGLA